MIATEPTCTKCPAFLHAEESIRTGVCHGCRSGAPTMVVETPPLQSGEWSCDHPLVSRDGSRGSFRCVRCGETFWLVCLPVTIVRSVFLIPDEENT